MSAMKTRKDVRVAIQQAEREIKATERITEDHIYNQIAKAVNEKIKSAFITMSFNEAERCCAYLKDKGLAVQTFGDPEFIADVILAVDPVWCMSYTAQEVVRMIPKVCGQRQDSLDDQIDDLCMVAVQLGMFDAADWLKELLGHRERYQRDYGEPSNSTEGEHDALQADR